MSPSVKKLSGKILNEIWNVGAKHSLYREDGKWFHQLKNFPGALFDANGYVVFQTEEDYLNSPYLQIQKDLHVPQGISTIPDYVRITGNKRLLLLSQQIKQVQEKKSQYLSRTIEPSGNETITPLKAVDFVESNLQPGRVLTEIYRIIRDTKIAQMVKYLHDYQCQICGNAINLGKNKFYAEAHHIRPLGGNHKGPDIVENILCVCPNHHAQLDFGAIKIDSKRLRTIPGHEVGEEYINYHNSFIFLGKG